MKGCKPIFLIGIVLVLIVFLMVFVSASIDITPDLNTTLEVPDVPPYLLQPIPNFTWPMSQNLTNAFNLYDYFDDANGDPLTFWFTPDPVENVSVIIDGAGWVSFYPEFNFSDVRTLFFNVSDGNSNVSSNLVYLNIGTDKNPPNWSNPSISPSEVEQNDLVNLSLYWSDDYQLSRYIFSIEQFGIWTNYSSISFSGTFNRSLLSLIIATPPGGIVRWRVYAYDTTGNMGVSDIFEFQTKVEPVYIPPIGGGSGGGGGGGGGTTTLIRSLLGQIGIDFKKDYDFKVDPDEFQLEILQGEDKSLFMTVSNIGRQPLDFNVEILNIGDLAYATDYEFSLEPYESTELGVEVSVPKDYSPGQYFGFLRIKAYNITKNIPIVLTVKHFDPSLDFIITVPEKSKLVRPGKNVTIDVNVSQFEYVKDLNGRLYLAVKDNSGFIYDFSEENLIIPAKLSFTRELNIPSDVLEGRFLVYGRVEFEDKFVVDAEPFMVGYLFKLSSIMRYGWAILLILILALIFIILFIKYQRSKKKERLLQLYLLLSRLKDKLKENDLSGAGEIYIKIKHIYGEPVPRELLDDKEFLKSELKRLGIAVKRSAEAREVDLDREKADAESKSKEEGVEAGSSVSSRAEEKPKIAIAEAAKRVVKAVVSPKAIEGSKKIASKLKATVTPGARKFKKILVKKIITQPNGKKIIRKYIKTVPIDYSIKSPSKKNLLNKDGSSSSVGGAKK